MDHDGKLNVIDYDKLIQIGSIVLNSDTGMQGYA